MDKQTIETATARLRREALSVAAGASLGGEEQLCALLEVSRPTLRQVARILEREGLLKVRRGPGGGYFAARPDSAFVEATVASYLEGLGAQPDDLARIATAVWIETIGKAIRIDDEAAPIDDRVRRRIERLPAEAGFAEVMAIETMVRRAVFDRIASPYVELIFDINANVARRVIARSAVAGDGTETHRAFVVAWRAAMLLLIDAIDARDAEIATIAARRCRHLLHERIWPN